MADREDSEPQAGASPGISGSVVAVGVRRISCEGRLVVVALEPPDGSYATGMERRSSAFTRSATRGG